MMIVAKKDGMGLGRVRLRRFVGIRCDLAVTGERNECGRGIYESQRGPKECMPFSLQPCMSSALPAGLDVMRTTRVDKDQFMHVLMGEMKLTLSLEGDVDILEHLHGVRTTTLLLGVEQDVALLGHPTSDHLEEDGAESLLHVGTDPDEEPVVELQSSREHGSDT